MGNQRGIRAVQSVQKRIFEAPTVRVPRVFGKLSGQPDGSHDTPWSSTSTDEKHLIVLMGYPLSYRIERLAPRIGGAILSRGVMSYDRLGGLSTSALDSIEYSRILETVGLLFESGTTHVTVHGGFYTARDRSPILKHSKNWTSHVLWVMTSREECMANGWNPQEHPVDIEAPSTDEADHIWAMLDDMSEITSFWLTSLK